MNINGTGEKITAVILAGGKSSRFGRDKSLLTVEGRLLLERSLDNWGGLFAEVIIVSESGDKFSSLSGIKETADIYRGRGPLGGVHAGLKLTSFPWSFVAACDMPHIEKELIVRLCAAVEPVQMNFARAFKPALSTVRMPSVCRASRRVSSDDVSTSSIFESSSASATCASPSKLKMAVSRLVR